MTDWFKGMVSLYDFCDKSGVSFKIHAKQKFDFEDFFGPNEYDWSMSDSEFVSLEQDASTLHLCLSESGIAGSETWVEQQSVLKLICGSGRVKAVFIHAVAAYGLPTFGLRFNTLFRMFGMLEESVENMRREIGGDYISVSFRFVNLLKDSSEEVHGIEPISEGEQNTLITRCISKLAELMENHEGLKVLVTTDSYNFLTALDAQPYPQGKIHYMKGEKIHQHIGFSQKVSVRGILKSYTEFMLISQAKEAFLVQIGPMYESKFPKWAASIEGIPYAIICEV